MKTLTKVNPNFAIVDEALANGDLITSVLDYAKENSGVVVLQEWFMELKDLLGLDDDVSANEALGKRTGHLLMRIKEGTYGDIEVKTDHSGIWLMDFNISSEQALRVRDNAVAKSAAAQKELKAKYRKDLAATYKMLDDKAKKVFKKAGGNMDKCIGFMVNDHMTAMDALTNRWML